jgi:hypothetical protein
MPTVDRDGRGSDVQPGLSSSLRTIKLGLVLLGASIVHEFDRHTWMRDPEGNDFCITDG